MCSRASVLTAVICGALVSLASGNYCDVPKLRANFALGTAAAARHLQLRNVVVVMRHGDRAPFLLPFPYDTPSAAWACDRNTHTVRGPLGKHFWRGTCSPQQLTAKGRRQMQELGAEFRARYQPFVDAVCRAAKRPLAQGDLYLRTTEVNGGRTRESISSFVAGAFPELNGTTPIETYPHETETMFPNRYSCPRAFELRNDFYRSSGWQAILAKHKAIRAKVTDALGGKDTNIMHVYDAFQCRACHHLPFPAANFTAADFAAFHAFANEGFAAFYDNTTLLKFHIGFFVDELLQRLGIYDHDDAWDAYPAQTPFSLFCGHDTTVAPFYKLLTGKSPTEWVPYGSHLTLELWEEPVRHHAEAGECAEGVAEQTCRTARLFVRALFNGEELDIPSCATGLGRSFCSLEDFVALLARWRISYDECYV